MSLATLFNIPGDEHELLVFSFSNMDQHRLIAEAVARTRNRTLPLYALDPIPPHDFAGWAVVHQSAHNDMCAALGIAGVDLTSIDINNRGQLESWIRLHGDEHMQAAAILGLP